MPYYIEHALVATCILLVTFALSFLLVSGADEKLTRLRILCGALAGAFFYIGREVAQWEDNHHFDWPGLLAPVTTVFLIVCWIQSFRSSGK